MYDLSTCIIYVASVTSIAFLKIPLLITVLNEQKMHHKPNAMQNTLSLFNVVFFFEMTRLLRYCSSGVWKQMLLFLFFLRIYA